MRGVPIPVHHRLGGRTATLPVRTFENALGGTTVYAFDVVRSMTDREVHDAADFRGMIPDGDDWDDHEPHFGHISDYEICQNVPSALREIEKNLSQTDSRFIGFAEAVAQHYRHMALVRW